MKKLGRNEQCPCGSGEKYKNCCNGKPFVWVRDDDGRVHQQFPVEGRLKEVIGDVEEEYLRHFERAPTGSDPMILGKYLYSEEDMERLTVEAMEKAGADPAIIYAHRKTGYIITTSSAEGAPPPVLQEWDDAIDEYEEFGGDPRNEGEGYLFDELLKHIADEIESLIFLFGLTHDQLLNTDLLPENEDGAALMNREQYAALCMSRTQRTLRSIRILLKEHMSEDVLKLSRSIYENYLHIVFVHSNQKSVKELVDAVIGVRNGSYEYKKSATGKLDKRVVIEKSTGEECRGHISAYKMAESSASKSDLEFFDFFYERTSEFLHPSIFALDGYLSEKGLDPVKPHMYEEGVVFSALVACMVADRIPMITGCPPGITRDVKTIVGRVRGKILQAVEMLNVWCDRIGAKPDELEILKRRCLELSAG